MQYILYSEGVTELTLRNVSGEMKFGFTWRGRRGVSAAAASILSSFLPLLLLSYPSLSYGESLAAHQLMSPEELARVFQVHHQDDVPDYEVINIHHRRHRRSAESNQIHQVRTKNKIIEASIFSAYEKLKNVS